MSGAGVAHLVSSRAAEATYTPGTPADVVDTNLTVQGNLVVQPGNVGVGTTAPQGRLDVAGDIRINGSQVIGTDGVAKQAYYAP